MQWPPYYIWSRNSSAESEDKMELLDVQFQSLFYCFCLRGQHEAGEE
jgi:hypothetical protein